MFTYKIKPYARSRLVTIVDTQANFMNYLAIVSEKICEMDTNTK